MTFPLETSSGLTLLPVDCFAPIARQRGAVWLDSSLTRSGWGRHSFMAADPIGELTLKGRTGRFADTDGRTREGDLEFLLDELERIRQSPNLRAVGFISYEAAMAWLGLGANGTAEVPEAHFFIYDRMLTYDNLLGTFSDPNLAVGWQDQPWRAQIVGSSRPAPDAELTCCLAYADYLDRVRRIKHHIREGDIYQANFTCRFDARSNLDPFTAYLRLRRLSPCSYGAYLNFGEYQVLSSSPERMFLWTGDRISSSPIKGTIARGDSAVETENNLKRLLNSPKDRAELLMIVDLVRNDLGRIAETGSVTVENLWRAEVLSSVIHLVADISARPRPDCTLGGVFKSLLPGGSVTGVPKRRAVEILRDLEVTPRSVYTGVIGYVGGGRADFNLAIRTMVHHDGCFRVHAGGGIVADSEPELEYNEMVLKAHNMLRSVGAAV